MVLPSFEPLPGEEDGERWAPPAEGPAVAAHFGHVEVLGLAHLGTFGEGAFGRVSLVRSGEKVLTLKVTSQEYLAKNDMEANAFAVEDLWKRLASNFVQRLYGIWEDSENRYTAMEPCVGGDLYTTFSRRNLAGQRPAAAFYAASVAEGLAYLHDCGVVYRDLKLENVLLRHDGTVVLGDFGLAKQIFGEQTKTLCGTPEYMAPEVIQMKGHGYAVDWWALGVLIHELLAGFTPFASPSSFKIYKRINTQDWAGLAASLATDEVALVKALCTKEPSERLPMQPAGRARLHRAGLFAQMDWAALREGALAAPHRTFHDMQEACANIRAKEEKRTEAKKEE